MSNSTNDLVLKTIDKGHHTIRANGQIFARMVEQNEMRIYHREFYIYEQLFRRGFVVMTYCRSEGLNAFRYDLFEGDKKASVDKDLNTCGLMRFLSRNSIDEEELVNVFRGFKLLATEKTNSTYAIIVKYLPHMINTSENGSIEEKIVAETLNELSILPSVERNGNVVLVMDHGERENELTKRYKTVRYGFPSLEEYEALYMIMRDQKDKYAKFDLTPVEMAKLSKGLSIAEIIKLFKEQKLIDGHVDLRELSSAKKELIERLSNHTLEVIEPDISFNDLGGLKVPKKILGKIAQELRKGLKSAAMRVLLCGQPGNGKTSIVKAIAKASGFNLVKFSGTIKSKYVGESEANMSRALDLFVNLAPLIIVIDEIDQSFKKRSQSSEDGGVSSHHLKSIFEFASRDDLRGKVCIIACSNAPHMLDPAMIDRFRDNIIPMIEPSPEEIAFILPKIQKRMFDDVTIDPSSLVIKKAAELMYQSGMSPRQLFPILNKAKQQSEGAQLSENDVLKAIIRFRPGGDRDSQIFSNLISLKNTQDLDNLPWAGDPNYVLPFYLEKIVNLQTGEVNELELNKLTQEYEQRAKF